MFPPCPWRHRGNALRKSPSKHHGKISWRHTRHSGIPMEILHGSTMDVSVEALCSRGSLMTAPWKSDRSTMESLIWKHSAFMETSTGFPWCCFHGYVHVDFVVTRWNGGSLLLWRPWRRYMMYLVHHRGSSFVMKEGKYSSALPTFLRV